MERNLTPTEHPMLMTSIDYITNHPHATTEAVPNHLLKFLSVPNFIDNPKYEDGSVKARVFIFILRLYHRDKEQISEFLNTNRFKQLFFSCQTIIAATLHGRGANRKQNLFLFSTLMNITIRFAAFQDFAECYEGFTACQVVREKRNNKTATI